jgi:predicted phosphodiesterase
MRFSLISDMHVDFPQLKTPYELLEEVVVVAGDTSNGLAGLEFLQGLKNKGHTVVAVDGNHEHYANVKQYRNEAETTARFREDHRRCQDIEGVPFVCVNGWYCVKNEATWSGYMNDGRMSGLSMFDINHLALAQAEYVEERLSLWKNEQRTGVVVTHTAPCVETLNPRYADHFSNEWCYNPHMRRLLRLYSDQIRVWCHGHTHASSDKTVEGVRVVCNPRGYPGENPEWRPMTIEV